MNLAARSVHQSSVVIDGLIISKWDRSVFEDMRTAGLSAANCTVSVWEGFKETVANIADMKRMIRGTVVMRARSNSRSSRSWTISMCSSPRKPQRNPKPSAVEVSGS